MSYKIALDVSGGDSAPDEIIEGAVLAKKELNEDIVLVGVEKEIKTYLNKHKHSLSDFIIVDAPEKIEMNESPLISVRTKKKSSIVVGMEMHKQKEVDAFVSCGNTGSVVCAATIKLRLIEGVERPGIALMLPTKQGVSLVIDVGANIDCKAIHLFHYGIMASVYCELFLNKKTPSVGLLNIGEEASKGLEVLKKVHKLFTVSPLNFTGNLEAKELLSGNCDCIVCDGFVGNIALKVAEGSAEIIAKSFIEAMKKNFIGKVGLFLSKNNLLEFKRSINYAEYGGAPLLGVDGIVIIGHGRSNSLAVKNAIKVAVRELKRDLTKSISRRINDICQNSRVREIFAS